MTNTVHNSGNICSEVEQNGITAHMQVLTTEINGAKVDPVGMLYKEETINGVTGRMPVVAIEGSTTSPAAPNHNDLTGREANSCHPASAISGMAWLAPIKGILTGSEKKHADMHAVVQQNLHAVLQLESPTTRGSLLDNQGSNMVFVTIGVNLYPMSPGERLEIPEGTSRVFIEILDFEGNPQPVQMFWHEIYSDVVNYPSNPAEGDTYISYNLKSLTRYTNNVWVDVISSEGFTVRNLGEYGYPLYHYEQGAYMQG